MENEKNEELSVIDFLEMLQEEIKKKRMLLLTSMPQKDVSLTKDIPQKEMDEIFKELSGSF